MKYFLHLLIITCLFSCTKKSDPIAIIDYKKGLFTAEINNQTYRLEKFYIANAIMPIGYFRISETTGGISSTTTLVNIKAIIDTDLTIVLNFKSNMNSGDPNEVEIVSTTSNTSVLSFKNSSPQYATKVIIRHKKGDLYNGSYEMYNGSNLLCKGQFSSE